MISVVFGFPLMVATMIRGLIDSTFKTGKP